MYRTFFSSIYLVLIPHFVYSSDDVKLKNSKSGILGGSVSFSCNYSTHDPWYLVQWKRKPNHLNSLQTMVTVSPYQKHKPVFAKGVDNNFHERVEHRVVNESGVTQFVFRILNIACLDVGEYICDISTSEGILTQRQSLNLISYPKRPSIDYEVLVVKVNEPFVLQCEGNIGIPPGNLQWYSRTPKDDYFRMVEHQPEQHMLSTNGCYLRARTNLNITIDNHSNGTIYRCFVKHSLTSSADSKYYDEVTVRLPELPKSARTSKWNKVRDVTYHSGSGNGCATIISRHLQSTQIIFMIIVMLLT